MEKLNDIYEYVCSVYGIDIKKDTRKRVYVEARALYYLLSRNATRFSLQLIADIVGRDHASVIHGIENVSIFLDKEIVSAGYIHFDMAEKASKKTDAKVKSVKVVIISISGLNLALSTLHLSLDNKRVDITSSDLDILVRIGKLDDSALIGRKLGIIRKVIVASPKYLEKVGEITYVDKLAEVDVLLMAALFKNKKLKLESNNEIKLFINIKIKL